MRYVVVLHAGLRVGKRRLAEEGGHLQQGLRSRTGSSSPVTREPVRGAAPGAPGPLEGRLGKPLSTASASHTTRRASQARDGCVGRAAAHPRATSWGASAGAPAAAEVAARSQSQAREQGANANISGFPRGARAPKRAQGPPEAHSQRGAAAATRPGPPHP